MDKQIEVSMTVKHDTLRILDLEELTAEFNEVFGREFLPAVRAAMDAFIEFGKASGIIDMGSIKRKEMYKRRYSRGTKRRKP